MARTADDRLTDRDGRDLSEKFMRRAEDLAQTDQMPLDVAIRILSGETRQPYGSVKKSPKR